tara:strand:+ start:79 stop:1116 length:1038 start_codon:yes stop_codon:yes gene_type:complete
MKNKFNIWNKWDPLKVCMLGNNFAPEFFDGLPNAVATPLKRICEETLEDLEGYKRILVDYGVHVIQPELDNKKRFLEETRGIEKDYGRGPLQPRDHQLILGNRAYTWAKDHPAIGKCLTDYSSKTIKLPLTDNTNLNSATVFMIGKDVYHQPIKSTHFNKIYNFMFKDHRRNTIIDGQGHTDGCFHPVKPGAIISIVYEENYASSFEGWDVCYLENESWDKIRNWNILKQKNEGKWWLLGEEDNDEFIHFVNTWLTDWVGYVEESVFDVNVLMLDEHHCCVSNPHNEKINAFFKKHKIEPVHVPWRHRWFWDGGLHCITLDLYREGTQQDYFPDRPDHAIDHTKP